MSSAIPTSSRARAAVADGSQRTRQVWRRTNSAIVNVSNASMWHFQVKRDRARTLSAGRRHTDDTPLRPFNSDSFGRLVVLGVVLGAAVVVEPIGGWATSPSVYAMADASLIKPNRASRSTSLMPRFRAARMRLSAVMSRRWTRSSRYPRHE